MIEVQTDRPVFSNIGGNKLTPEQKLARKKRLTEKAKGVYGKAKESGILASLENLALGNTNKESKEGVGKLPTTELEILPPKGWKSFSTTKKGVIITSSLLVVGLVVYFTAFKKK